MTTLQYTLTAAELDGVTELLDDLSQRANNQFTYLHDYSPAGQHDSRCFAVVTGNVADFAVFVAAVALWFDGNDRASDADTEPEWELVDLLADVHTSFMGLDMVFYFPTFTLDRS